ncbi:iron-sulfur cluster repair di-iron protein [Porphyromonadaceae bacterium]
MGTFKNTPVGDIVTRDFRAAEVFKKVGIDFCCGGKQTLEEACADKKIDIETLQADLNSLSDRPSTGMPNFNEWELDFLCDYIERTHHKTVRRLLPELSVYIDKIYQVHGLNHPELAEIHRLFTELKYELTQHLHNEETVLFPAIKEALKSNSEESRRIIESEIKRMDAEHEFAGGAMDQINVLTNGYTLPADGCNTYMVAYKLLEEFEDDLHIHVHLENNILYPKSLIIHK